MGLETVCTVLYDGEVYEPKVLLETEAVVFRGALKKTIPFREMTAVSAEDEALSFLHGAVLVEVRIGPKSTVWADKIVNPKSLLDKLGVKPGEPVSVIGVTDATFRAQLAARTKRVAEGVPDGLAPWIFYQVDSNAELGRLRALRAALRPAGAIWVVHPKGRPDIKDVDVIEAAKAAGLVDVKVVAFSKTHSALKLVVPLSQRV
jgi:hypothetical protein